MLRTTAKLTTILTVVSTLLLAVVTETGAEPASVGSTSIRESISRISYASSSRASQWNPPRPPCNAKRRALAGAAIGSVVAMLTVKQAARENDGSAGPKTTLSAGGYGAALGAVIGLATCR